MNRGLGWVGLASTLVSLLDFIALVIILAMFLTTSQYGIVKKAVWIFPILDLATDLGLSAAVIQRDDHTESKIATVFWLNLMTSVVLFGALYAASGPLSDFYGHAVVGSMVVVYGTKLIWQNLYFIPASLMRRELRYRELSVIRIVANLAEFGGKVGSAAAGAGVWCFVIGPLCRVFVTGVGVQLRHPWRPRLMFRLREALDYIKFGFKTSGSKMLFYFYSNVDYPIVGYYFGDHALGLYSLAYELVLEPVRIISDVVVQVAFAAFSRLKAMRDQLVAQFVAFVRMNLVTVMSFLAVVYVVAAELLVIVFGDDKLTAAPAVRVLCAVGVLRALGYVVPPLLDGLGYAGRTLIYQAVAAVALPGLFWLSAVVLGDELGFFSVALAWAIGYPLAFAVLVAMALDRLELRLGELLRPVIGIPVCTLAVGAGGLALKAALAGAPAWLRLVGTGGAMLAALAALFVLTQGISPRGIARSLRG